MKINRGLGLNLILVAGLGLFLAACSLGTIKIGKILDHPRDYDGKEVTVQGEVTDTYSFLILKNFKLKDNTGEITVVTTRILPKKGETIKVTGTVQESFTLGAEQSLVIVEKDPNQKKESAK